MKGVFNGVLERIGYEERSEENVLTKCLRQEVAKWACIFKDPTCIQMAKNKLERHIIHSEKYFFYHLSVAVFFVSCTIHAK